MAERAPKGSRRSDSPRRAPAEPSGQAQETAFSKLWYWFTFTVSLLSLVVLLIFFRAVSQWYIVLGYWIAIVLAIGLGLWATGGLLTRYRVVQRIGESASRRQAAGPEGSEEEEVVYRENLVVRLFKLVGRLVALLFLFVWNTVLRIVYIIEITILQSLILGYDLIYYTLYLAWSITYWAVRISWRVVRLALRISWTILRILTRLPLARGLWDKRWMPRIMGRWNARVARFRERAAKLLENRRRLVMARGLDPDKWQADWEARHRFPLPHPHDARKGLRERIEERQRLDYNRRDRWGAYRKGQPIPPKLHSERKRRRDADRRQMREEQRAEKKQRQKKEKTERAAGALATVKRTDRFPAIARPAPDE